MASPPQPTFATYLLPSFNFPFRRRSSDREPPPKPKERQASTDSTASGNIPSLSYSPSSSASTTPASSPPSTHFIPPYQSQSPSSDKGKGKGILYKVLQSLPLPKKPAAIKDEGKKTQRPRLYRARPNTLHCSTCSTDIALSTQIVSKGFTGRHGRAYLVAAPLSISQTSYPPPKPFKSKNHVHNSDELINIRIGRKVNRELLTGMHVVADVTCLICGTCLGWKYVDAKEEGQKYKVGKFILECMRVVERSGWEDVTSGSEGSQGLDDSEGNEIGVREYLDVEIGDREDVVVFDSEDEDECEDLFAGVWDAEVVRKRRGRRVGGWRKGSS